MASEEIPHPGAGQDPHHDVSTGRLNWLRAGVLGANDGVVSTASIVLGVAGATASTAAILTAGLAGLFAGAMSMAVGEYVSVSTQRDAERAMIALERRELADDPQGELAELAGLYEQKGLPPGLAADVARHLTEHDALAAHAELEFGLDPEELTSPWQAALASFVSFSAGAILPLLAMVLTPPAVRVAVTALVALLALAVTGSVSARLGQAHVPRAVLRNVGGGLLAMAVTYAVGTLVGTRL